MAIETIKRRVCDLCGEETTARYRLGFIEPERRLVTVDLCETHAEPFEALRPATSKGRGAKRVASESQVKRRRRSANK